MSTAYSNLMTNLVATPQVQNPVGKSGGRVRRMADTFEVLAADVANADVILLCRLPTNVRIKSIKIGNDELDSNGSPTLTFDLGVQRPDGTAVNDDCFVTSSTQFQSAAALTELLYETLTIADTGKYLWEHAGLTEDPGGMYDIAITFDAANATAAAGTIAFEIEYTLD